MKKYLILILFLIPLSIFAQNSGKADNSKSIVKYVMAIDYPHRADGGKDKYMKFVERSIPKLYAPTEYILEIQAYDNYFGSHPNRIVEFYFSNMEDAAKYWSDDRVKEVLEELPNYSESLSIETYILRSDYIGKKKKK